MDNNNTQSSNNIDQHQNKAEDDAPWIVCFNILPKRKKENNYDENLTDKWHRAQMHTDTHNEWKP